MLLEVFFQLQTMCSGNFQQQWASIDSRREDMLRGGVMGLVLEPNRKALSLGE